PAARLGDGLDGRLGHCLVDVVDDHRRAVGGQGVRVGEAEAPAATGDDGDLAGEIDAGHGWVPSRGDAGGAAAAPRRPHSDFRTAASRSKLRAIIVDVYSC